MLQLNRGNLFANNVQFSEIGQLAGLDATDWSWSALMTDLDNDGWKDVFITNGILRRPTDLDYIHYTYDDENVAKNMSSLELAYKMPEGAINNYVFKNSGKLVFEDVSSLWGFDQVGYSMGAAYADLDNDGDLDLVVNNLDAVASVYRNNSEAITKNNFIKVILQGTGGNTFGIGARVEIELDTTTLIQVVNPSRGWLSSVDYTLNFGLGKSNSIKKISVLWPDGRVEVNVNPAINTTITSRQLDAKQIDPREKQHDPLLFENITEQSGVTFIHRENAFNDFNAERLIPHQLSAEGPRVAVADLNNDGLDDFYIGGAAGQAGELFYQKINDTTFRPRPRRPRPP
jgi:hypothetical protein